VSCALQEEDDQPEPPKRTKQANQYFWRRHYLSIIQGTGFCLLGKLLPPERGGATV
jgi:hypothetical protein